MPAADKPSAELPNLEIGFEINGRYRILGRLGAGGAGTVYRAAQMGIDIERAVKILDPKISGSTLPPERFLETFQNEIKVLAQITHRNIVKIIDADRFEHSEAKAEFPYYVMELVHPPPGETHPLDLGTAFSQVKDKKLLVDILIQLLDGIRYLHGRRPPILHSDIKPSNILLDEIEPGEYELRISDVGVSKILAQGGDAGRAKELTYLYGSPSYAPEYAQEFINRAAIPFSTLLSYFPHFDLFCLGATLAECFSTQRIPYRDRDFKTLLENPKTNLSSVLDRPSLDLLKRMVLKLVSRDRAQCYSSANEVREEVEKLKSDYLRPLGVEEMAVGGAYKTITQPRERVYLSQRAYEIVKHPVLQRLENLKQLSFVYHVYPGATHTRFNHVLTAYEMSKRYIEGLLGDTYFRFLMKRRDYEVFLACALLHDTGHYPLAHALEDLRNVVGKDSSCGIRTDYEMAQYFLTLKCCKKKQSLADILARDWGIDYGDIVRIIAKGEAHTETEHFIQSMIDGAIDVDKVSYLLLDSFQTGARFGLGMDIDAFLPSLVAIPPTSSGPRTSQLGISENGIAPAESIITARYGMFSRVYWHRVNRAVMAMLQYAVRKLFLSVESSYTFERYIEDTLFFSDAEAVRHLASLFGKLPALKNDGREIAELLTGIVDGRRWIHKRLCSFSGDRRNSDDWPVYRALIGRDLAALEEVRGRVREMVRVKLGAAEVKDSAVLFDVPRTDKESDALKTVYVSFGNRPGKYIELHTISKLVEGVHDNFINLVKKCRVFLSPDVDEACEAAGIKHDLAEEVRSYLAKLP